MQAIVSRLDAPHAEKLEALWAELASTFGVRAASVAFPHITFQVVEQFDQPQVERILARVASTAKPFVIRTSGLSVFTGERPVLHMPVARSPALDAFHRVLWDETSAEAIGVHAHYGVQHWMPHITLAINDLRHEQLPPILDLLSRRVLQWEIAIENVCLVCDVTRRDSWVQFNFSPPA